MSFAFPSDQGIAWGAAGGMLVLLAAWRLLAALERHRSRRLQGFAEQDLLARLIHGYAPGIRRPLNVLVLLGLACLLAAAAQPHWGQKETGDPRGSREILVLLDTSESMNAVNPPPNRLARARQKISTLLATYPADRFGLVAFSGGAALQCPLTLDHAYFKTVLESVTTDSLSAEGTDIESAFAEAEKLFVSDLGRGRGSTPSGRIVLLVSDGEQVSGDAVAASRRLAPLARVAVMGIGNPDGAEVTLPEWMSRSKYAPPDPRPHWSALDEENLSAVALAGNGVYVRSTLSDDDLAVIGRELERLDGVVGDRDPRIGQVNRYRWPLALAAAFFAAEGAWLAFMPVLARRKRRGRTVEGSAHGLA